MRRLALLLLFLAPAPLRAQAAGPAHRIRIVVYRLTTAGFDPDDSLLVAGVERGLVRALAADSLFEVVDQPGESADPARPSAQYAIIGSMVLLGAQARVDLRVVDIANVQLLARPAVGLPLDAPEAPAAAGAQLARMVHAHFADP